MTREQAAIARRLRRLVQDARKAGVALVADADCGAIRIMSTAELRAAEDLRIVGEPIDVHGGCGGGIVPRVTASGNG